MTRINVVPPSELSRQHLIAEYRELPRVFTMARKAYNRGDTTPLPTEYTLGKGHVRFFYDKLAFLAWRYLDLISEMRDHGYKPNPVAMHDLIDNVPKAWFGMYEPTQEALVINRVRIKERS